MFIRSNVERDNVQYLSGLQHVKVLDHFDFTWSFFCQARLDVLWGCFPVPLNLLSTHLKRFLVHFLEVIHLFDAFSRCFTFKVEVGRDVIWAAVFNVAKNMQQILVDFLLVI